MCYAAVICSTTGASVGGSSQGLAGRAIARAAVGELFTVFFFFFVKLLYLFKE